MSVRPATGVVLVLAGLMIGAWSALCGIGGGVFAVPLLHYAFKLPLRVAVGSSLLLVASSTSSATLNELLRDDGAIHGRIALILIATSLVGARLGFVVAQRLDARVLKGVFVAVLLLVAAELVFAPLGRAASGAALGPALVLDGVGHVWVALIGLGAGFVAPLLGVGGGLVAVPALFLGIAELGFLSARASSMAMSVVTAWQSGWLYRREQQVELRLGLWLALGALGGGWIGVALVHIPGATVVAQRLLAATLVFVALRFLADVVRRPAPVAS